METIKFYIPFQGFYDSIFTAIVDDVIEDEIMEGYITAEQDIDYKTIYEDMAEHIFNSIVETVDDEYYTNFLISYEGLDSPRYYNFRTDKLKASCSEDTYKSILEEFKDNDELMEFIDEASISRDGFTSFYEGYEEVIKEPSIYLEYLFQWLVFVKLEEEILNECMDCIRETIYNNI